MISISGNSLTRGCIQAFKLPNSRIFKGTPAAYGEEQCFICTDELNTPSLGILDPLLLIAPYNCDRDNHLLHLNCYDPHHLAMRNCGICPTNSRVSDSVHESQPWSYLIDIQPIERELPLVQAWQSIVRLSHSANSQVKAQAYYKLAQAMQKVDEHVPTIQVTNENGENSTITEIDCLANAIEHKNHNAFYDLFNKAKSQNLEEIKVQFTDGNTKKYKLISLLKHAYNKDSTDLVTLSKIFYELGIRLSSTGSVDFSNNSYTKSQAFIYSFFLNPTDENTVPIIELMRNQEVHYAGQPLTWETVVDKFYTKHQLQLAFEHINDPILKIKILKKIIEFDANDKTVYLELAKLLSPTELHMLKIDNTEVELDYAEILVKASSLSETHVDTATQSLRTLLDINFPNRAKANCSIEDAAYRLGDMLRAEDELYGILNQNVQALHAVDLYRFAYTKSSDRVDQFQAHARAAFKLATLNQSVGNETPQDLMKKAILLDSIYIRTGQAKNILGVKKIITSDFTTCQDEIFTLFENAQTKLGVVHQDQLMILDQKQTLARFFEKSPDNISLGFKLAKCLSANDRVIFNWNDTVCTMNNLDLMSHLIVQANGQEQQSLATYFLSIIGRKTVRLSDGRTVDHHTLMCWANGAVHAPGPGMPGYVQPGFIERRLGGVLIGQPVMQNHVAINKLKFELEASIHEKLSINQFDEAAAQQLSQMFETMERLNEIEDFINQQATVNQAQEQTNQELRQKFEQLTAMVTGHTQAIASNTGRLNGVETSTQETRAGLIALAEQTRREVIQIRLDNAETAREDRQANVELIRQALIQQNVRPNTNQPTSTASRQHHRFRRFGF